MVITFFLRTTTNMECQQADDPKLWGGEPLTLQRPWRAGSQPGRRLTLRRGSGRCLQAESGRPSTVPGICVYESGVSTRQQREVSHLEWVTHAVSQFSQTAAAWTHDTPSGLMVTIPSLTAMYSAYAPPNASPNLRRQGTAGQQLRRAPPSREAGVPPHERPPARQGPGPGLRNTELRARWEGFDVADRRELLTPRRPP